MRVLVPPVWLLSALFASIAPIAAADPTPPAPSLWDAEIRAGYGVELDGGQGAVGMRTSPLTIQATVAFAVVDSPRLYGYGGMIVETLDRSSVGAVGGVELRPDGSIMHVAAGGTWLIAPYSLWGADADVGACKPLSRASSPRCAATSS